MRIAVDAMGGDYAPRQIVKGAVEAARELPSVTRVYLVGDETAIRAELAALNVQSDKIEIVHASEVIEMDEAPAQAVRRKKDSSVGRAVDLVKSGKADAVVSAGNTGAVVVASTLKLRTLEGVDRPAIAAILPTQGRPLVLIDAGANTDCTPAMLAQFSAMGTVYSQIIMHQKDPVVGLVSIGGEESKGNESTKETFKLLTKAPVNFRGNVEGHDIFLGETDVVVCDGFVGNIILKTAESVSHAIVHWMKREFKKTPWRLFGAAVLKGAFKDMKKTMDPEMHGGALLLGVNGVCIISHGAASPRAIFNAVRIAAESVDLDLNQAITDRVAIVNGAIDA